MHLIVNEAHQVVVAGKEFALAEGEGIHTENSYKYSVDEFSQLATANGFTMSQLWHDDNNWFGVFFLTAF